MHLSKKTKIAIAAACAATAIIIATAGACCYNSFYGRSISAETELYIRHATSYDELTSMLTPHLRHPKAFGIYARHIDLPQTFKPGHYVLKEGMNAIEVARMLKIGEQTPVRVVINNVRIPAELAGKLARQLEADSVAFMKALTSDSLAREVGFDSLRLFSMFIPNTYEFWWTVTPDDFVKRMKREYDAFWTPARDAALARCRMSRLEAMTLASILYEETKAVDEMPRIAGVYINRLRKGMLLQADPTVKYALQDFKLRRILHSHLKVQSPYNTYVTKGLPPSPICMPSIDAIDAVLRYEEHPYIYFCARPEFDGHHNFASSYSQHLANARAYVKAFKEREKARAGQMN